MGAGPSSVLDVTCSNAASRDIAQPGTSFVAIGEIRILGSGRLDAQTLHLRQSVLIN